MGAIGGSLQGKGGATTEEFRMVDDVLAGLKARREREVRHRFLCRVEFLVNATFLHRAMFRPFP